MEVLRWLTVAAPLDYPNNKLFQDMHTSGVVSGLYKLSIKLNVD